MLGACYADNGSPNGVLAGTSLAFQGPIYLGLLGLLGLDEMREELRAGGATCQLVRVRAGLGFAGTYWGVDATRAASISYRRRKTRPYLLAASAHGV